MNVGKDFLSVAEKFDKDRGSIDDTNGFFSCNGYGVRNLKSPSCHIYNLLINYFFPPDSYRDGPGERTKLNDSFFSFFIIYTRYIDIETGRRSDTAHHYIYNQDHNKNLKVLARHRVVRVIFEYVFISLLVYLRIIIFLFLAGVPVQSELNMLTIQLEEQRVLLSHS